jgi:hypothetical protein
LRILFILKERSSEILRQKIIALSENMTTELNDLIEDFTGDISVFEKPVPQILSKSISIHYKHPFKLADELKIAKTRQLTKMETRLINVIKSYTSKEKEFLLPFILKMTTEKNEDLIIEAIEGLIQKEILIPSKINLDKIRAKKPK